MEEKFPGFGGCQNRNAEGTVGPHGELFSRTAPGGLGCSSKLARAASGKTQESQGDWKRYPDRSPPRKFSSRGETTNAEQHFLKTVSLLELEDRSC